MKFLCDRCKTRYSIGDDRVRGKILKIRCKNCANVITVREGMDADGSDLPARAKKPTTMAPMPESASGASSTGSNTALGQAFASAMTKPPPALEEEWYVSIDGDQSGPFTLAEAQRWVAAKPHDADLHCWSEGFDDWLPVDKVSHFRNLRKKAPSAAPPPLPRVGGGTGASPVRPAVAAAPRPEADEPKPLFAATMASLEKASAPVETSRGFGASTPSPLAARGAPAPLPSKPVVPNGARPNGLGAKAPAKPLFDNVDIGESTTIEPPPFNDEAMTAPEPVASAAKQGKTTGPNDAATTTPHLPAMGGANAPQLFGGSAPTSAPLFGTPAPAAAPVPLSALSNGPSASAGAHDAVSDGSVEDDGLDIGEVSRVVKLADIVRGPAKPRNPSGNNAAMRRSNPALQQTGAMGRMTGPVPRIAGTGPAPAITNPGISPEQLIGADGLPVPLPLGNEEDHAAEQQQALANPTVSHKRGLIALIAGAVGLIAILLVVVVVVTNTEDDYVPAIVAQYDGIDTTGREIIIQVQEDGREVAIDKATGKQVDIGKVQKRPTNPIPQNPPPRPPEPAGEPLSGSDVEAMAAKYNSQTVSCWRRAGRGAEGIIISDVKKVQIFLTVAKDGSVSSVSQKGLPGGTNLEKCLAGMIRSWKFRTNRGGDTFAFTMLPPS